MSRIGKKPIIVPENVKIDIVDGEIKVSGPLGNLAQRIDRQISLEIKDGQILVTPVKKDYLPTKSRALWGLYRSLISNMITGVTKGFEKKLELEGVGYRVALDGKDLTLNVGFTLPVKIKCPEGVKFTVEKNVMTVSGFDKAQVGQIAAIIRAAKKAEPYKGKGIKYAGEKIRRKEGKKVVSAKK
ncbi:MAG: 50S ribosomal protein L6 [Candidatus Staskawiczbacteria bacterium]|jgi:large subunit ribosomal protein L6